jgi:hypothetical protein
MRKMRLEAAPAAATLPTAMTIPANITAVSPTAIAGEPLDARTSPTRRGMVRSFAMANATREAPTMFARSADSIDRTPAPMTSQ